MQHSAIHDPRANYTFSQRQDIERHKERLAKIKAKAAARTETPVAAPEPSPVQEVEPPAAEPAVEAWAKRQQLLHPLKEPWFSIEAETAAADPVRPKIDDIQRVVAGHYRVTRFDLISPRRTAHFVRPRQVAMYLAKTLTLRSLPEIGRKFGNRDHSTALHAIRKIERLVGTDSILAAEVALLTNVLGGAIA